MRVAFKIFAGATWRLPTEASSSARSIAGLAGCTTACIVVMLALQGANAAETAPAVLTARVGD